MADHDLAGARLLIVEDEYFIADDARLTLAAAGARILGPVATAAAAHAMIDAEADIDGVILDVDLRGEKAFDLADALRSRAIPFAFMTGYDREVIPERFADAGSIQKPVRPDQLLSLVKMLLV